MPIYEYRCSDCGHEFEALQKISESPLSECPACHAPSLRKKVSAAGFQLKGSGWYVTDFRNSGAKQPAKDGNGKAGAKPNASDTTADTKSGESKTTEATTTTTKTTGTAAATESKSTTTTAGDKSAS